MDDTQDFVTEEQVTEHVRWLDEHYDQEMDATRDLVKKMWNELKGLRELLNSQIY